MIKKMLHGLWLNVKAFLHDVEAKVKWSTVAAYLASSAGLWALQVVQDDRVVSGVPSGVASMIGALAPAMATAVAGWRAKHTPRV